MNKFNLLISIFLISFTVQLQAQRVEIKSSRLHGLLVYVFSNAGLQHYSPYLKELTDKSEYKDQVQQILSDFSVIEQSLNQAVNYRQNIRGYGDGFAPDEIFEIQSAYATDIDDLFIRLQHTMPLDDLMKFKKYFKKYGSNL